MPRPPFEEMDEDELEESLCHDDAVLHELEKDIVFTEGDLDEDEIGLVEDFEHDHPWED